MTDSIVPTVVLHGALGSAAQLAPLATELGALAPATVIEFPGHGATPLQAVPFTIAGFAAWLVGVLRLAPWRAGRRPVAFGYSMGGYVALAVEARHPGTFGAILTLGTRFGWTPEGAATEGARLDAAAIREKVPRFAAALEARHAACGGWEGVLRNTAALLRELGERPLLDAATLGSIRIPVCVARGTADDTVSEAETRAYAAMIRGATVVELPGAPHPVEKVPTGRLLALMRELRSRMD